MRYLLDTNIVLLYLRDDKVAKKVESNFGFFSGQHDLFISVVTVGELESLLLQRNYGAAKVNKLAEILDQFGIIDINIQSLIAISFDLCNRPNDAQRGI